MMDTVNVDTERGLFTPPSPRKIAFKLLISGVIFAAIYGMFQLDKPWAIKGKLYITAALTQSYDFTAFSSGIPISLEALPPLFLALTEQEMKLLS